MATESRRIRDEDFDILDSEGIPRPFRGGVRGGVNQKRSYPIMKYVVTVFVSSTPAPSSQEEGMATESRRIQEVDFDIFTHTQSCRTN